ncbi:MAG: tetratricopeptide repeat protein, partial [Myxococcota bacterium]|nr:tetratricopeptide repeat protein [Myxococcota bacterium]
GDIEPLAATLFVEGQIQAARGDFKVARATLLEAVRAATAAREDGMVVEIWLEIVGMSFRGFNEGLDDAIFSAEVAAQRLAPDDLVHAQLAAKVGSALASQGESERAVPMLQRAAAMWTEADATKHRLEIAGVANSLGVIQLARGEWAEARRNLEHALAAWQSVRTNANTGVTLGVLGDLALLQRDFATAEPLYRRALVAIEATGDEGRSLLGSATFQLAYLLVRTARCAEAEPLLARARDHAVELYGEASAQVGLVLLAQAMCELDRGRPAQAIAILERAKPLADADPASFVQIPTTDFALARALDATRRDRKRALALAERARTYFGRYAGLALDRAEVEAWLAARR